jgi:hypothetical protein
MSLSRFDFDADQRSLFSEKQIDFVSVAVAEERETARETLILSSLERFEDHEVLKHLPDERIACELLLRRNPEQVGEQTSVGEVDRSAGVGLGSSTLSTTSSKRKRMYGIETGASGETGRSSSPSAVRCRPEATGAIRLNFSHLGRLVQGFRVREAATTIRCAHRKATRVWGGPIRVSRTVSRGLPAQPAPNWP